MSNSAHIRIDGDSAPIYIYTHWNPAGLVAALKEAVESPIAQARVGDPEYFNRIVIQRVLMAVADPNDDTGYGISTSEPGSDAGCIATVNSLTGKVN